MDEHNVHNFWGASPFIDFGQLLADVHASQPVEACMETLEVKEENSINILQVFSHVLLRAPEKLRACLLVVVAHSEEPFAQSVICQCRPV
jgi:hypothetical protein